MCLLGSRWWMITFRGPKSPKKTHFGGLNRHFKPNMRKIQIAISSDLCIRLTWNFTASCSQQQRLRRRSRLVVKQFQNGGRPPFLKSMYRHYLSKNHLILMKFCTQQQILNWMNVTWSKMIKLHLTDSEFDRTYLLLGYKNGKITTESPSHQQFHPAFELVQVLVANINPVITSSANRSVFL